MAASWPGSLEKLLDSDSFDFGMGSSVARSSMDVGPDKVRRTSTRPIDLINCTLRLHKDSFQTFYDFFNTTLNGGVLPFTFLHPLKGAYRDFRFTKSPSIRPIGGNHFTISMSWEDLNASA